MTDHAACEAHIDAIVDVMLLSEGALSSAVPDERNWFLRQIAARAGWRDQPERDPLPHAVPEWFVKKWTRQWELKP